MPVVGHILGTLWVMTVGAQLDNREDPDDLPMYEHSYGNRLRKNLYKEESDDITYSPHLFEPYFSQYEGWRDRALDYAKQKLTSKQDALILTLDLRSYFYGIHISRKVFDEVYPERGAFPSWAMRVHSFVYQVMERYSDAVRHINKDKELNLANRVFLPIGFLPSNILSNWFLNCFDAVINEQINPVYYGRYVDDIIIVDKVEKNSPIRKKAQGKSADGSKLTAQDIIEHYFLFCPAFRTVREKCAQNHLFVPLKIDEMTPKQEEAYQKGPKDDGRSAAMVYRINPAVLPGEASELTIPDIQVQNDKVKVFYFREGATRALLDCFRTQIGQNASEFRTLPDMDHVLEQNDYSEIFKLHNSETLHKLRGVESVTLDRFSFSKFLGKYRKTSSMIRDKKENAFERDLFAILSKRTLIENYTLWERLLEIMVVNDRLDSYERLVKRILDAVAAYQVPDANIYKKNKKHQYRALLQTLRAALCRTSALCWGKKMDAILENIEDYATNLFHFQNNMFSHKTLMKRRVQYCQSRMVNKYVVPLPVGELNKSVFESNKSELTNLCRLETFLDSANRQTESEYIYYPYMVTPQEISYALACRDIAEGAKITSAQQQWTDMRKIYLTHNFCIDVNEVNPIGFEEVDAIPMHHADKCVAISVKTPSAKKIKLAVGNARLYEKDFRGVLTGKPNRSHERYRQISKLLKEAIAEKVDMLVLPESYLPWEWIPDVSRLCANNQMALVTGIEHILSPEDETDTKRVYNLTAVILPYTKDGYKFAHTVYHQKTHFSPGELRQINGYRHKAFGGNEYQLFRWRDLWFSVYCCFELASIQERSYFQSYADLTVAVEWNKDVVYFSSIVESLCRDLHCYCVQANSSDYGDSRVLSPSNTVSRDIIKTKGGKNHTILVDEIDVDALREYQRKEYELQRDDKNFKPTPPNFERSIPERKQNGSLWRYIKRPK